MILQKKKLKNRSLSSEFQSFGNCNGVSVPRLINLYQRHLGRFSELSSYPSSFTALCVDGPNDRWIVIVFLAFGKFTAYQSCTSYSVSFSTIRNYFIVSDSPYYGYVELFLKK